VADAERTAWRPSSAGASCHGFSPRRGGAPVALVVRAYHFTDQRPEYAWPAAETDWARIAAFYGAQARFTPSPVVELNRAGAVGITSRPQVGLEVADGLVGEPVLASYHLLHSVRGDLLARLRRVDEARAA
jgi:predicted RNA polymerase sigma factor